MIRRANKMNSSVNSSMVRSTSSRSLLAIKESKDEDDLCYIPDERDWKKEIQEIKKRTGDFNINNYLHILSDFERIKFNRIVKKIPEDKRVYIQ